MPSKIIIIATTILLVASFAVLFVVETKSHDFDYKKSWSAVYFDNPRDSSLDFTIENHQGEKTSYGYQIMAGSQKIAEGVAEIEKGSKQKIKPRIDFEKNGLTKITIEVNAKDANYKIYKNL